MEFFLLELKTPDWRRAATWYVRTLGFAETLRDDRGGFVLLELGGQRLALKRGDRGSGRLPCRLVFRVEDLDAERDRLIALGEAVDGPFDHPDEGYRELRLSDPDGTSVGLFAWSRPPTAP